MVIAVGSRRFRQALRERSVEGALVACGIEDCNPVLFVCGSSCAYEDALSESTPGEIRKLAATMARERREQSAGRNRRRGDEAESTNRARG